MTLEDTVGLMCSDDTKWQLKAEYVQLMLRKQAAERLWFNMDIRTTGEAQHWYELIAAMNRYREALRKVLADNDIFYDSLDAAMGITDGDVWAWRTSIGEDEIG